MPLIFKPGLRYTVRQTYTAGQAPGMSQQRGRQTLNVFVQALEGQRVVVELRHDAVVRGMLQEVDSEMNLTLVDVTCRPLEGKAQQMEFLYVKGRHVRYIHFSGSVNAATLVEDKRGRAKQALGNQTDEAGDIHQRRWGVEP
ncbi:hypothetical protein WJX81_008106 [Elliptochloris bilobata]|uniref:Sm domain-containing protein n=1 Tax=Elliptochloris bilobata TaxID=381761 RepID=A0AAW1SGX9_9CHLO